jgi:hypothetical protein
MTEDEPHAPDVDAFVRSSLASTEGIWVAVSPGMAGQALAEFPRHGRDAVLLALRASLDRLAAIGELSFPADRKGYNNTHVARLPERVRKPPRAKRISLPEVIWHPRIAAIGPYVRDAQTHALARQVNDFLVRRGASATGATVDFRERALEITGDEKAFDGCRDGVVLSGPDGVAIRFSDLGCQKHEQDLSLVPVPGLAGGKGILVVENQATYRTLSAWNRGTRTFDAVAYGAGNAAGSWARQVRQAADDMGTSRVSYFGDIDAPGIDIAVRFDAAMRGQGLEAPPCIGLYGWLVRHGKPMPVGGKVLTSNAWEDGGRRWLGGGQVTDGVVSVIASGRRIAQEWLNGEVCAGLGKDLPVSTGQDGVL